MIMLAQLSLVVHTKNNMTGEQFSAVIPDFDTLRTEHEAAIEASVLAQEKAQEAARVATKAERQAGFAKAKPERLVEEWRLSLANAPDLYQASFFLDESYPSTNLETMSTLHMRGAALCRLAEILADSPQLAVLFRFEQRGDSKFPILGLGAEIGSTRRDDPLLLARTDRFDVDSGVKTTEFSGLKLFIDDTVIVSSRTPGFDDETWIEAPSVQRQDSSEIPLLSSEVCWGGLGRALLLDGDSKLEIPLGDIGDTRHDQGLTSRTLYIGRPACVQAREEVEQVLTEERSSGVCDIDGRGFEEFFSVLDSALK